MCGALRGEVLEDMLADPVAAHLGLERAEDLVEQRGGSVAETGAGRGEEGEGARWPGGRARATSTDRCDGCWGWLRKPAPWRLGLLYCWVA